MDNCQLTPVSHPAVWTGSACAILAGTLPLLLWGRVFVTSTELQ